MATVLLQSAACRFPNGVTAVRSLDLEIRAGEFLVLAGPSGSGKTTVLRIIAGLESLSAGTINIDGRPVNADPPHRREVAMVFQRATLFPQKNVFENIACGLRLRGNTSAAARRRVEETASLLQLEKLLDRSPRTLSGGELQRVAIARALAVGPKILLLDEPLSNLDGPARAELREVILALQQQRRTTTLYVTHDQEESLVLGERLAVISSGELQQCGPPSQLYDQPCNHFVARFLGNPPMQFLEGRLEQDASGAAFVDASLDLRIPIRSSDAVRAEVGKPVRLGIRPEHFRRAAPAEDRRIVLEGTIRRLDLTGGGQNVHVQLANDARVIARGTVDAVSIGSSIRLALDSERVLLFALDRDADDSGRPPRYGHCLVQG